MCIRDRVSGGAEPWLMARWKARVEFLLSVIELHITARRNARIASASYSNSVSLSVRLSVRHTLLLCFDTIPACDRLTDGIAVANTALAMRALRAL